MKQSINKFFVGFLFVLAIAIIPISFSMAKIQEDLPSEGGGGGSGTSVPCIGADCWGATVTHFGQTQIENTRTNNLVYIFNMSKKVYEPGEAIVVLTDVLFPTCGNATVNVILEGQISGQPNHYTIVNENLRGGYGIYGAGIFTPPFQAPSTVGNYLMNVKAYIKKDGWFYTGRIGDVTSSQTPTVVMEQNLPFSIVSSCGTLDGYTKCANEGQTCAFSGTKNVAYGKPGLQCVFQDGTDGLLCNNTTFGFDPIPDAAKSCYFKPDVVVTEPTVKILANGKNPYTSKATDEVNVTWTSENATHCNCVYGPGLTGCGSGIGGNVKALDNPYTLAESKTFTVTCDDNVDPKITPPGPNMAPQYYKLQRCTDLNMVFETGPFPMGTYSTGDRRIGAVEGDPIYNYVVTGSSNNPIPGAIHNILTSGSNVAGCPN